MMDDNAQEQEDCEVEEAVETLLRADEIRADPELMAKVVEKSKEKQSALKSITGLRKRASQILAKSGKDKPDDSASEYGDDPELRTDDDRAALQESKQVDDNLKQMGMGPKKKS